MSLLIRLTTPTENASYEGCSLALTMATFGQQVQLLLDSEVLGILIQPDNRLHGMVKSLDLYDMPKAWLPDDAFSSWVIGSLPPDLADQIDYIPEDFDSNSFDNILTF